MVTKEEFGQLIADFEAFRDLTMEELGKVTNRLENIEEDIKDIKDSMKMGTRRIK